jgi:hypothetical protein
VEGLSVTFWITTVASPSESAMIQSATLVIISIVGPGT